MDSIHPVTVPFEPLTFPLRAAAKEYPQKTAVITPETGGKEYSYEWLDKKSSAFAAALEGLGVKPRDHIALWLKNSMEYIGSSDDNFHSFHLQRGYLCKRKRYMRMN